MPIKTADHSLGAFLRDRRSRMDPAAFGFSLTRRRTPGLRREEVALLANVSLAWYTWLEQGRGGTPSSDVLDRLAKGLSLSEAEREHLFILAQNRPPEIVAHEARTVDLSLQHLLDALESSPALIRDGAWDVLAVNRAGLALWNPEGSSRRFNSLEDFFGHAPSWTSPGFEHWMAVAKVVVAQFRSEAFQSGFGPRAQEVVNGLIDTSPAFAELWDGLDVGLKFAPIKTFHLPSHGKLSFELTHFSVDDAPGLKMVVFNPATPEDQRKVLALLNEFSAKKTS